MRMSLFSSIREYVFHAFRAFVISSFISVVINNILYIHVRMNPSQDIPEWITIEYFAFIYAILLGIAIFLTPFPSIRNYNLAFLLRIIKSFCLTAVIILPYYYYLFTVNEVYSYYLLDNEFLEKGKAISIIFAALLFAVFFYSEKQKKY